MRLTPLILLLWLATAAGAEFDVPLNDETPRHRAHRRSLEELEEKSGRFFDNTHRRDPLTESRPSTSWAARAGKVLGSSVSRWITTLMRYVSAAAIVSTVKDLLNAAHLYAFRGQVRGEFARYERNVRHVRSGSEWAAKQLNKHVDEVVVPLVERVDDIEKRIKALEREIRQLEGTVGRRKSSRHSK